MINLIDELVAKDILTDVDAERLLTKSVSDLRARGSTIITVKDAITFLEGHIDEYAKKSGSKAS